MKNPLTNNPTQTAFFESTKAITFLVIGFISGIIISIPPNINNAPVTTHLSLPETIATNRSIAASFAPSKKFKKYTWEYTNLQDEIKCLADNMYFETRNQPTKGKISIGLVTINRVKNKHFKNNICDVVWFKARDKRTKKMTAHFSWTLDGKPDTIHNKPVYERIRHIAEAMLAGGSLDNFHDFTKGATHYHANYVTPYWISDMTRVAQISDHILYKK